MSTPNTSNTGARVSPENDIEARVFFHTYLENRPESLYYKASSFKEFELIKFEFGKQKLLWIPFAFTIAVDDDSENFDMITFWDDVDGLCYERIESQIRDVYRYKDLLDSVEGYTTAKQYLLRALVKNDFLWTTFLSACGLNTAKEKFEEEKDPRSKIEILLKKRFDPSYDEKQNNLKCAEIVWKSLKESNWWKELSEWSETTAVLLEHTKLILQRLAKIT